MRKFLPVLALLVVIAACVDTQTDPTGLSVAPELAKVDAGMCVLASGATANTGFDEFGYNRCAHVFNGPWAGYCTQRGLGPDCYGVRGDTHLNMKWNEEWDRGNATGWAEGPYDARLDNQTNGWYEDGTPFSEHFKTRWDQGCADTGGAVSSNGGECIWGQFEVLMYQGKEDGLHLWWSKLTPAGYGN